jgi:pimeloyl-ACP methyl ester carboxylesterase
VTLDTDVMRVEGRRLRYATVGSGPPLLCLHGYPETLQLYSRLGRHLAEDFEVVAIDWPGLGASDPWPGAVTPTARSQQIHTILDALGYETVFLMGTDMGGPPALLAAADAPDRITGVVVSNSLVFGDGETSPEISLFRALPVTNRLGLRWAPHLVFRRCLATFLPPDAELDADHRDDFWRHFRRLSVRDCLVEMCADYEAELAQLPATYRTVSCPVLACWGRADHHFPPSQGRRLAATIDQGTLAVVDAGHHWMIWDRARTVAEEIRDWADHCE